jgi:hypothetical protein
MGILKHNTGLWSSTYIKLHLLLACMMTISSCSSSTDDGNPTPPNQQQEPGITTPIGTPPSFSTLKITDNTAISILKISKNGRYVIYLTNYVFPDGGDLFVYDQQLQNNLFVANNIRRIHLNEDQSLMLAVERHTTNSSLVNLHLWDFATESHVLIGSNLVSRNYDSWQVNDDWTQIAMIFNNPDTFDTSTADYSADISIYNIINNTYTEIATSSAYYQFFVDSNWNQLIFAVNPLAGNSQVAELHSWQISNSQDRLVTTEGDINKAKLQNKFSSSGDKYIYIDASQNLHVWNSNTESNQTIDSGVSRLFSISDDGNYITYGGLATGLKLWDQLQDTIHTLSTAFLRTQWIDLNSTVVVFTESSNGIDTLKYWDIALEQTVSIANNSTYIEALSDGTSVLFSTENPTNPFDLNKWDIATRSTTTLATGVGQAYKFVDTGNILFYLGAYDSNTRTANLHKKIIDTQSEQLVDNGVSTFPGLGCHGLPTLIDNNRGIYVKNSADSTANLYYFDISSNLKTQFGSNAYFWELGCSGYILQPQASSIVFLNNYSNIENQGTLTMWNYKQNSSVSLAQGISYPSIRPSEEQLLYVANTESSSYIGQLRALEWTTNFQHVIAEDVYLVNSVVNSEGRLIYYLVGYENLCSTSFCRGDLHVYDSANRASSNIIAENVVSIWNPSSYLDEPNANTTWSSQFLYVVNDEATGGENGLYLANIATQ